jgi:hypothetical protein
MKEPVVAGTSPRRVASSMTLLTPQAAMKRLPRFGLPGSV